MSIAGVELGFVFISKGNQEPIEGVTEVQSGEELLTPEAIEKSGDEGEWVAILDGNPIEGTIVDTKT